MYLVSVLVAELAKRRQVKVTGRLAAWVMNDLRVKVFTHLQRLSLDYFTDEKAGVVMTRMTSDIENLQQLLQDGLAQFAVQGLTMIVITVILFTLERAARARSPSSSSSRAHVVSSLWFRAASERGYLGSATASPTCSPTCPRACTGSAIVAAHNRQRHNVVHHRNVVGEYRDANNYTAQINAIYGPGTQLLGILGQAVAAGHRRRHGAAPPAHPRRADRLLPVPQPRSSSRSSCSSSSTTPTSRARRRSPSSARCSTPSRRVPEEPDDAVELPPIDGEIVFDHVTFGYDPADPVLHDVNLRIAAGETVAFVGPTGAGKSTMAKLVTRFYDPTDGARAHRRPRPPARSRSTRCGASSASCRRSRSSSPAPSATTSPSPGPTPTDDEVCEAVRPVGLTELIERLPDGLDTVVHERGQSLSSGERQLIALARAFLAHPRVLVLDEATSNLDLQSETKIEARARRAARGPDGRS